MATIGQAQLGKQGLTDNFLKNLKSRFKKTKIIKVSVLKSCCRNREDLKEIEKNILNFLGNTFTLRTIGYTITIKKWRRAKE